MANSDSSSGNKNAKVRKDADLSVSIAGQPVPKLPHEHDESVESQVGGPKPATVNSNSAPGVKPRVKN
jgi:hypothetical protein